MKEIKFNEFNNILLEEISNTFPNTMIIQTKGGDYLQDVEMKLIQGNIEFTYSPYKIYKQAKENNNYEEVIEGFINNWDNRLHMIQISRDYMNWKYICSLWQDKWIILGNIKYDEDGALLGGETIEVCTDETVDDAILKYRKQGKRYLHLRTSTSFNNGVQIV